MTFQVVFEVFEALHIFLHFVVLRICHEDDAVNTAKHQLTGGIVNDLPRHGVELELGFESLDGHCFNGQEVKKQGAV